MKNFNSLLKYRAIALFTIVSLLSFSIGAQKFNEVRMAQLSTGAEHTLAIDTDGKLWAWGNNLNGQVAYSVYENYYATPIQLEKTKKFTAISAGYKHSLAIDESGTLFQWGYHCVGDAGDESWEDVFELEALMLGLEFAKISAGSYFNLAIDKNGNLYAWGDNTYGQLGVGNGITARSAPTQILIGTKFVEISAGAYHSMAIDENGGLWVWGMNADGQLGNGEKNDVFVPLKVSSPTIFVKVAAGLNHSLALDNTGAVYTCGSNLYGQMGIEGIGSSKVFLPLAEVGQAISFSNVFGGWNNSFAVSTNGKMYAWGVNSYGQLGCNDQENKSLPVPILTDIRSVVLSSKSYHALSIDTDGYLYGWGLNDNSQLGLPTIDYTLVPKVINSGKTVNISAGGLSAAINNNEKQFISELTVTGTIDARDFAFMRDSMSVLTVLDISSTSIESYMGTDGTGDGNYLYLANEISFNSFYNATTRTSKLSLAEVYLPATMTLINDMAFYYCSDLKKILFAAPSQLTTIKAYAFGGCSRLDGVVLPESLIFLGNGAFYFTNHSTFNISAAVTYIGNQALALVKNQILVNPDNPNYKSIDGVLYSKDEKKLLQCPSEKEGAFEMPLAVESVERAAFIFCRFLTSITNSPNLKKIEDYAFYECNFLSSYEIPIGVTAIKPYTFAGCNTLTSIAIPRTVLSIGNSAFWSCVSLTSISIPNTITSIGSGAFNNCTGLTSFYANPIVPINLSTSPNVFQNVNKSNCILYVQSGSLSDYKNALEWKDFLFIEEMTPTSVSDLIENGIVVTVQNKQIKIRGVCLGEQVSVYSIMGAVIFRQTAASENVAINIKMSGVYLVKIGDQCTKVIVR